LRSESTPAYMVRMRAIRKMWAVACALGGLSACGDDGAAQALSAEEVTRRQGCAPSRTATAYRAAAAGSEAQVLPDSAAGSYPCLALTGYGANEPGVGVARDGTVYFAPGTGPEGVGVLESKDEGATWALSLPKLPDGTGLSVLQPFFYLEPETDRLFFATSKLVLNGLSNFKDVAGIHLTVSDDGGRSWSYQSVAPHGRDWHKIFAGKPVTSDTGAEPHVIYLSVPSPIAGNWAGIYPPPDFQYFYKSTDGGKNFREVSKLPLDTKLIEGCVEGDYAMFGQGVAGPDGTIYLGYRKCQQLAVVVSHDEGSTWEARPIPGAALPPYDTSSLTGILSIVGGENAITGQPIAVDDEGNLYAVWAAPGDTLRYATSRDGGASWSAPVWVMAPGVTSARMVTITAKSRGQVALSYFGTEDGTRFHGYIAESHTGLEPEPTFWSVTANDPSEPLYAQGWQSGYDLSYFDTGGPEITLLQITYAPSGDVWASFVKDMCPAGQLSRCTWDYAAHGRSRFQGAVGRLHHGASR